MAIPAVSPGLLLPVIGVVLDGDVKLPVDSLETTSKGYDTNSGIVLHVCCRGSGGPGELSAPPPTRLATDGMPMPSLSVIVLLRSWAVDLIVGQMSAQPPKTAIPATSPGMTVAGDEVVLDRHVEAIVGGPIVIGVSEVLPPSDHPDAGEPLVPETCSRQW